MLISASQINQLKQLLLEITGKEYSTQELQTEGLKILRFVYAKEFNKHITNSAVHKTHEVNPEVLPQSGHTSPNNPLNNKESKHEN